MIKIKEELPEYDQLKVSILLKTEVVAEIDRIIEQNPDLYHNRSHFVRRGIFLALQAHRKEKNIS